MKVENKWTYLLIYTLKQSPYSSQERNDALIGYHYSLGVTSSSTCIHYGTYITFLFHRKVKIFIVTLLKIYQKPDLIKYNSHNINKQQNPKHFQIRSLNFSFFQYRSITRLFHLFSFSVFFILYEKTDR